MFFLILACAPAPEPDPVVAVVPVAQPPAPPAPAAAPEPDVPTFDGATRPLTDAERAAMTGVTWHPGCPVDLDALAAVQVTHWWDDRPHQGLLVVHADHAEGVLGVFRALFDARFPIERVEPAVAFGGSDDAMMDANNTSAFNCRAITGGSAYSEHSYGHALDLNPRINPYVRGDLVLPESGRPHVDRDPTVPGLIVADDAVVQAFAGIGWSWGGAWTRLKDYQHFSATGK